jgi:hypothetical protein
MLIRVVGRESIEVDLSGESGRVVVGCDQGYQVTRYGDRVQWGSIHGEEVRYVLWGHGAGAVYVYELTGKVGWGVPWLRIEGGWERSTGQYLVVVGPREGAPLLLRPVLAPIRGGGVVGAPRYERDDVL